MNEVIDLDELITNLSSPKLSATTTLADLVTLFIPAILFLAGIGLLFVLVFGGFQFLTSAGDPKKMEAGKNTLTWGVIGFVLIIAAFAITQLVSQIFSLGTVFQ